MCAYTRKRERKKDERESGRAGWRKRMMSNIHTCNQGKLRVCVYLTNTRTLSMCIRAVHSRNIHTELTIIPFNDHPWTTHHNTNNHTDNDMNIILVSRNAPII